MTVKSCEKLEKSRVALTIEVGAEEFEAAVNKAYLKMRGKMNIPGFRPGKAPRKMIESMYGAEVFYEEAVNAILPDAYESAVDEQKLEVVGYPQVEIENVGKEGATFKCTVAVYPEVELGQYKGLEAVKAEAFDLEIGSGSFVPGFEDQLIGMKAGEEKDIDITFPENYTPELAGKPVVFHVKVNEVKVKELPAIDDEFAKDVSEFDTLKELKADIKKKMTDERTTAAQHAFEDVLMTKVAEGIKADIPDEMIEMQAHQMLEGFKQQLASQGIPFDQYTKMTGMNEEQIIMDAKEPAANQVRMDLAIRAIIKAEGLEVSDEEVETEMKTVAEKYGMDLETVKKYLRAEDVKEQVMRGKVIKVVADSATAVAPEVKEEETKTEEDEEKKD